MIEIADRLCVRYGVLVLFVALTAGAAGAASPQAAPSASCNQATTEPITHVALPGNPF